LIFIIHYIIFRFKFASQFSAGKPEIAQHLKWP